MKIAFVSYEYPPDSAYGGIATYVRQAAKMLSARGHYIEVFSSSPHRSGTTTEESIIIHRIVETNYENFSRRIDKIFAERHASVQFDVLEGPEYGADAYEAVQLVPDIPLVVKLHTPTFLTVAGTYNGLPLLNPLRIHLLRGRILKYLRLLGKKDRPPWRYTHKYDLEKERLHTLDADEIVAPSRSIGAILIAAWKLDKSKVFNIPYPFTPSEKLLNIPVDTHTNVITFLGRLEVRKGVIDLARAIPYILSRHPRAQFRFIGSSEHSHKRNLDMRQYLQHTLRRHSASVDFTGPVRPDSVPEIFAATDICVFPSIWENFANVCLESMAAARGIVASHAGGMAEMLDFGTVGRTVPPCHPARIAEAVIELLEKPELRMSLGQAARDRLLREYNIDRIGALQEASYGRAIARRRALGARAPLARHG